MPGLPAPRVRIHLSIRFRLTLLYSGLLALTLVALGVGIDASVSHLTLTAAGDAVTTQTRSIASTVQPHLGPPPQGAFPQRGSTGSGPVPWTAQRTDPGGTGNNQLAEIGIWVPPPDVAAQNAIQIRSITGTVVYQSQDLRAAKATLPLSTVAREHLTPGTIAQSIVTVGRQRLLVATLLLDSHAVPTAILQVARSLQAVDQTLQTLRQILLLGGIVVTLIACGAGWWLAGTALRPINRITQTAAEIGATQDFGRRVAHEGPADEVGRLASTFNTMLSRLQAAYQTQRRFVADASHELRTPLTSIRGNLNLLERQPPIAEADRVAVLADLVSETERLARLVNDLLALARSDTGRTLARQAVPLRPLIAEVVRRLAVLHPDRAIREEAHGDAVALGDRDALTQLLLILLDKALKFTPSTGLVATRSATHHDTVTLEVRDTGAGIAAADLPHIFDRFYHGDLARAGTGAGLGLAIARTIVDGLDGTIAVESEPGQGTRFTVTLPRAAA